MGFAISERLKDIENRTWAPNYKGRILIHASSTKVPKNFADRIIFGSSGIWSDKIDKIKKKPL